MGFAMWHKSPWSIIRKNMGAEIKISVHKLNHCPKARSFDNLRRISHGLCMRASDSVPLVKSDGSVSRPRHWSTDDAWAKGP